MWLVKPPIKDYLSHSAKGSEWKNHKYIQKKDGTYIYPSKSGSGGSDDVISKIADFTGMKEEYIKELQDVANTKGYDSPEYKELCSDLAEGYDDQYKKITDTLKSASKSSKSSSNDDYSDSDIEKIVQETIKGSFGNGEERKKLLGEHYDKVQSKVNSILKKMK